MSIIANIEFDGVDPATVVALEELARKEHLLECLRAEREQIEFARAFPEMNSVEGLGQVRRNVPAFAFHDWARKLGSYQCWSDPGFNRYFDRLAPETRVRCRGTKTQVGYTGRANIAVPDQESRAPRFRKVYA